MPGQVLPRHARHLLVSELTSAQLSIVLLVHNRPRLTRQALESLARNTRGPFNLTVVDDGSGPETQALLTGFTTIRSEQPMGPGPARNAGIAASSYTFGRPGLLYTTDNDSFHLPGWDEALLNAWNCDMRGREGFQAIGGACHPYQRPIRRFCDGKGHSIAELEALGLFSWLMSWETFDKHGPFAPSPAVNGSEDWEYCQRIRKAGGKVGVVEPACVVNCGVTSSDGRPCPGAALLYDQAIPEGVVIE